MTRVMQRMLATLATLLGALALLFALTLLVPGNPAAVLLGPRATPAQIDAYTRAMGLDRPVAERFGVFVWRVLHGDFGTDVISGRRVLDLVLEVLPNTVALALAGIGPQRTTVRIWADPTVDRNIHTIKVEAEAARLTMTVENVPSEANPRTGKLTPLSVLACLRGLTSTLKVGT